MSHDFSQGLLDRETDRNERGKLLDGLVHFVRDDNVHAASEDSSPTQAPDVSATGIEKFVGPRRLPEMFSNKGRPQKIGLAATIGIAVLGLVLWPSHRPENAIDQAPERSAPPGVVLVQNLMSQAQWSHESVASFRYEFDELTLNQRHALVGSDRFKLFVADLRRTIRP